MAESKLEVQGVNSKGFGVIPKLVMQDRNLSISAKALYSYFCSFAGAGGTCFPTRQKICFDLGISNDSLSKYMKELLKAEYISCNQIKENGKFSHNVYVINSKIPCPKISDTENSEYEKMDTKNNNIKNNSISNINIKENIHRTQNSGHGDSKKNPLCRYTKGRNSETDHTKSQNEKQVRHKYGEYQNVLLSDQEYEKLKNEFPNDYKERIERLSEYVASSGKKYKSFLATIRSWARKEKNSMKNINTEQPKKIRDGSEYAMYD